MVTKVDIEAGILKAAAKDVMHRGKVFYERYIQLQAGMRRLASGKSGVQMYYQPEYTYRRLRDAFKFSCVTMFAHCITVTL